MNSFAGYVKAITIIAGFLVVTLSAFAAGKKTNSDVWSWQWMGTVEDAGHMFPNTNVTKFKDTSNGVVCYVYSSTNATRVTFTNNGVAKEGIDGSEIGAMSCVSERR